jgi:hypothetical protein
LYGIHENVRCGDCFLRESCIEAVLALLQEEYDFPRERFEVE